MYYVERGKDTMSTEELFIKWCKKLRISPQWDIKLEFVNDPKWKKNGDFKIDPTDRKAILMLNAVNQKFENIEEVIVHELMHIKMYPLDQVCESLIQSNFKEGTNGYKLAYNHFFDNLEMTVSELTKCFLLEFGENKSLSYGRCAKQKSFNELYDELNPIK